MLGRSYFDQTLKAPGSLLGSKWLFIQPEKTHFLSPFRTLVTFLDLDHGGGNQKFGYLFLAKPLDEKGDFPWLVVGLLAKC